MENEQINLIFRVSFSSAILLEKEVAYRIYDETQIPDKYIADDMFSLKILSK